MNSHTISGLSCVDSTIEERLLQVEELRQSPVQAVSDAANCWHNTAQTLLASGVITPDMGVSEACLENKVTIGADDARLNKARMDAASRNAA